MSQIIDDNSVGVKKQFNIWVFFGTSIWFLLILMVILRIFIFQQVSVVGASMEPNYITGQLLFVNQIGDTFKRGQVVAAYDNDKLASDANYFTRFSPSTRFLLKRVIGLPGEEIELIGDKVIIYNDENPEGVILREDYISNKTKVQQEADDYYFPRTIIEEDHYFLMGDNRNNSTDSRRKGGFADYAILGYETLRFWPLNDLKFFSLPKYDFLKIDDITNQKLDDKNKTQSINMDTFNQDIALL
jgi:signal peptidase I